MATTWGGTLKHMSCGIDVEMIPTTVGPTTTSVTVRFHYYVRSDGWDFADSQSGDTSGDTGAASFPYFFDNNSSTNAVYLGYRDVAVTPSTSGTVTVSTGMSISGIYAGAGSGSNPSHSRSYAVPEKPTVPGIPTGFTVNTIGGTTAFADWIAPADNGGLAITNYQVQLATNSGFTTGVSTQDTSSSNTDKSLTGLSNATHLWGRVRAYNSAGWSDYSAPFDFTTLGVPGVPLSLAATYVTPVSAVFTWAAPASNGGSAITQYQNIIATNVGLTGATPVTDNDFANNFVGLTPNTHYYISARALNAIGWGPWATPIEITTLSAGWLKKAGTWKRILRVYIKKSGTWKLVTRTWVKRSGLWR